MLQSFTIKNFRQFESVSLRGLRSFNLITGLNGSGKSSLLEALFLLSGANNVTLIYKITGWRGETQFNPSVDYPFRTLFRNLDPSNTIELSAKDKTAKSKIKSRILRILPILTTSYESTGSAAQKLISGTKLLYRSNNLKEESSLEWKQTTPSVEPSSPLSALVPQESQVGSAPEFQRALIPTVTDNPFQLQVSGEQSKDYIRGHFISPRYQNPVEQVAQQLNQMVKDKRITEVIALMAEMEPRVTNIAPLTEFGRVVVYVDVGLPKMIPLTSLGSGFLNYLRIGLDCLDSPRGILLIDEIEDGIHHSLMKPLLRFLLNQSLNFETQIFATTHSKEILENFYDAANEMQTEDVCALRLQKKDSTIRVRNYSHSDLVLAGEMNLEIRG